MPKKLAWLPLPLLSFAAGCAGPSDPGELQRALTRWEFTMGHRGEGLVTFRASNAMNEVQSGECREAICQATIEFGTTLTLTAVPAAGFTFRSWVGDPPRSLRCPVLIDPTATSVAFKVEDSGACIAVFEPAGTTPPPTTPGAR